MEWISVNDRLPDGEYDCLVVVLKLDMETEKTYLDVLRYALFFDGKHWLDCRYEECLYKVKYWMQYPEAPKN